MYWVKREFEMNLGFLVPKKIPNSQYEIGRPMRQIWKDFVVVVTPKSLTCQIDALN